MTIMLHRLTFACLLFTLSACDVLSGIAPAPAATAPPTATFTPAPTATLTPTMGPREYIDAAYCWKSHIDTNEFNLVRFFSNGVVVDVFVQPYASCEEAWQKVGPGLTVDKARAVSHGEYYLSGEIIQYTLAKPGSDEIVGEVNGRLSGASLILHKLGAAESEYVQVYSGN
jgi:hypothetical protein